MDNPSYYAIIPASVRYDDTLCPNAKLLYGEITALCNKEGRCWAGNAYFANLYGVSKVSISKWVRQLVDAGFIQSEIQYAEGSKEILNRYITLINEGSKEKFSTPQRKVNDPIKEKFKDNNTVNTTTNITINNNADWDVKSAEGTIGNLLENPDSDLAWYDNVHFDAFWSAYPVKKGKLAARKAWDKLKLSDDVIKLIAENLKARMDAGEWEDKQYVPHPATFLNGRRWEDEVSPVTKKPMRNHAGVLRSESIKGRSIEESLVNTDWAYQ
jgi:hypothetical protein